MEWCYGLAAHKVTAIDAGHVCQNLSLSCSAIGCGMCAVAAYDQQAMDALLGVDVEEEFTVYLAPMGKVGPALGGSRACMSEKKREKASSSPAPWIFRDMVRSRKSYNPSCTVTSLFVVP